MVRPLVLGLTLTLALWTGMAAPAAADPVFPLASHIGLEPPPGMTPSPRFLGFEDAARKAVISIAELPLPAYENIERTMFDKPPPNLTVEKRGMLPFANGVGFLLTGVAEINDTALHRWYFLAREVAGPNFGLAAFITVEVPEQSLSVYSDKTIRAALSSVTFRTPPLAEQLQTLPFKLGDLAGFRVMKVIPGGGVILTDGPADDITRQPYMIVAVGTGGPAEADDRARFSREVLSLAPLRDISGTSGETLRLGGVPVIEIRAKAVNLRGDPVQLVQWMRFGGAGYLRVIGVVAPDGWDAMFTRFRAVRDGVQTR